MGQNVLMIELTKDARKEAVASIERYFRENMEERIGNIAAGALLNFFMKEVGPTIYNKAVLNVQERLQARLSEIDIEYMKTNSNSGGGTRSPSAGDRRRLRHAAVAAPRRPADARRSRAGRIVYLEACGHRKQVAHGDDRRARVGVQGYPFRH